MSREAASARGGAWTRGPESPVSYGVCRGSGLRTPKGKPLDLAPGRWPPEGPVMCTGHQVGLKRESPPPQHLTA